MSIAHFCTRCGTPNPSGLEACPNCGAPMRLAFSSMTTPSPPPAPLWGMMPPPPKRATIGTILGDTLSTFGKDFLAYVGVFLVFAIAITLINLIATTYFLGFPGGTVTLPETGPISADLLYRFLALTVILAVVGLVIQSILTASLTYFAVQRHRGTPATLGQSFDHGIPRVLSVLGASILPGLLLGGILAATLGLLLYGALTLNLALLCGAGIALLVLIPVGIYVTIALSLYAPAIVFEGKTAIGGLKRSWELTRRRRGTLFLALIVLGLLIVVIDLAATVPFVFVADPYVASIGSVISTAITGSWMIIMYAVAYDLILSEPPLGWLVPPPPYGPVSAPAWPPKS